MPRDRLPPLARPRARLAEIARTETTLLEDLRVRIAVRAGQENADALITHAQRSFHKLLDAAGAYDKGVR